MCVMLGAAVALVALVAGGGAAAIASPIPISGHHRPAPGGRPRATMSFRAVSGTHGANHWVLRRAGARLQLLDTDTGAVVRDMAFASVARVLIAGADGRIDNTLTLDFFGGSLAVPGGISYVGGRGGYNVLATRGGHFAHELSVPRTPHAGRLVLDGTTIRYAEIAPISDLAPAASYALSGTGVAETMNVVNGPVVSGTQTTQLSSASGTFELTNFANKTNVTISGGTGGGDTFDVHLTTAAVGLTSLAIHGTGGVSTYNVTAAPSAMSLALVGSGADTANVGVGSAQAIFSPVTISDPPSFVTVHVDDSANASSSRFVTLAPSGGTDRIQGLSPSTIAVNSNDVGALTVDGGSAGNTFVVSGITAPLGGTLPVAINTGTGVDSTFVQGTGTGTTLAIQGQSGNDGVAVSNAGTVQGILGPVSVSNTVGATGLVVDDSNDATARTSTLSSNGTTNTIHGVAPADITSNVSGLGNFTLDGGGGGNALTLSGLGSHGTVTINTGTGADSTNVPASSNIGVLNINGQSGSDAVDLGADAGSVQHLKGAVSVTNSTASALTINDSSDAAARTVNVGTTAVSGLAPAAISYTGVNALTIEGSTPSDAFTVVPSASTTDTVIGGGTGSVPLPGNTLTMNLTGATSPVLGGTSDAAGAHGTWTFGNLHPVTFANMQSLNPTALSLANASTTIGGSGSSPLEFPATLLAPATQPVSATYATADASATAASGAYQPATGSITFPAGVDSRTISVMALGQPIVRSAQTLTLSLANPVNATLQRSTATGTITDSYLTPATPAPTPTPTPTTPTPTAPTTPIAPVVTNLAQTHATWREGTALATISRSRPPIGSTFSFALNQAATVTLTFNHTNSGRKSHGRCVSPTKQNHNGKACRFVTSYGPLQLKGRAGANHIRFQGRLSRTGALKPGRYTLVLVATNTAGQHSPARTLTFVIVR
jgi:hypothetical protein